ncbi:ComEA family DNA-binding protein [Desulfolithobacter sp.]
MTGSRLLKKDKRLLVLLAFGWWFLASSFFPWPWPFASKPSLSLERGQGILPIRGAGGSTDRAMVWNAGEPPPRLALLLGRPLAINQADARTLAMLPGIGPRLAENIIRFRREHGPIQDDQTLLQVAGIGRETLKRLRPLIIYDQQP